MHPALEAWCRRGRVVRLGALDVFALEAGPRRAPGAGSPNAAPLLLLHGFPTSSFDFHRALPHLAARRRIVLHDHPGFGLSAKPAGYSYSLIEQADTALGVWRELGVSSGHLLAHDYGTSVATELLARRERGLLPIELASVTLSNGSVFQELARLRLSQRLLKARGVGALFARLVGRRYTKSRLRALWGDPRRARDEDLEAMWEGIDASRGRRVLPVVSRYVEERYRFRERWHSAVRTTELPLHVLWGDRDPVAVPAIAESLATLAPTAKLTWLEGLGHYPMLEDAETWSGAALGFLERLG